MGSIVSIGNEYFRLRYIDEGAVHKEDRGLWRADKVRWDHGYWVAYDDDDWMITDDLQIVAREIGWSLRREKVK